MTYPIAGKLTHQPYAQDLNQPSAVKGGEPQRWIFESSNNRLSYFD